MSYMSHRTEHVEYIFMWRRRLNSNDLSFMKRYHIFACLLRQVDKNENDSFEMFETLHRLKTLNNHDRMNSRQNAIITGMNQFRNVDDRHHMIDARYDSRPYQMTEEKRKCEMTLSTCCACDWPSNHCGNRVQYFRLNHFNLLFLFSM